jgi:hypothetical protein
VGVVIELPRALHEEVMRHLLPADAQNEEAAFLFVRDEPGAMVRRLTFVDWIAVERAGFMYQSSGYLELADEMRPRIIKRAHDLDACIVEMHSHPYPWPAAFSSIDLAGLEEFVPHVRWRLKGKPYVAIVVAPSGFDAMAWTDPSGNPESISGIAVAGNLIPPTGITLAHGLTREAAHE